MKSVQLKEWFVTTPAVALLKDGKVSQAWEDKAPNFNGLIKGLCKKIKKSRFFI